jgi:type IV secretory pathway VirJ component
MKLLAAALMLWPMFALAAPTVIEHEAFGQVRVYGQPSTAQNLVFLLFDRSVPGPARDGVAERVAKTGTLAAVIDIDLYLDETAKSGEACLYHSWEFEKLSKYLQKTLDLPQYHRPLLVGLGQGAALAYTTLTEAPQATFAGLVTVGGCVDFAMPKALCANEDDTWQRRGSTQLRLKARSQAEGPWVVLPSSAPDACPADSMAKFFAQTKGMHFEPMSSAPWAGSQWQRDVAVSVERAIAALPAHAAVAGTISDLPLEEVPAPEATRDVFAVILTGDGGWAGIDREIADGLMGAGMNVVGFNSLQYFWRKRTPEETTQAVSRVIAHYQQKWNAAGVVLVGYSFGADILPFIVNRLPDDQRTALRGIAMLALGRNIRFEFRIGDWMAPISGPDTFPILPEAQKMPAIPTLCVYGAEEEAQELTSCPFLAPERVRMRKTEGGHHFDGDYAAIARAILDLLPAPTGPPRR